jgi:glutathione S-transferase
LLSDLGADKPSIADLSAYQEVIQLRFMGYSLSRFPNIERWIALMENIPEITDENRTFEKIVKAFRSKTSR